jgi:hypothetical protein
MINPDIEQLTRRVELLEAIIRSYGLMQEFHPIKVATEGVDLNCGRSLPTPNIKQNSSEHYNLNSEHYGQTNLELLYTQLDIHRFTNAI